MFKEALNRIGQLLALKKNKTHYADCVIRDEKGRICLLHRSYQDDFEPGKWCLPGGHIEDGEEPIIAAGRELEEETGYKDVPLFYLDKVDRKDSVSLYYEGFVYSQTAVLLDNDEHYRIQWVEPKDLDDYELLLDLKDTLAKLALSPVPTLPNVAPMGEDLYTLWQNNLTSFDEGKIDESVFFKTVQIHKAVAAYELVTRAFDNDEITPEEFSRVHNIEKAERFDQALELAKGTDTEVLEEIVKSMSYEEKLTKRALKGKDFTRLGQLYDEWNTDRYTTIGYKKPSETSVLEFFQNNYEDYSKDETLKKNLLSFLERTDWDKSDIKKFNEKLNDEKFFQFSCDNNQQDRDSGELNDLSPREKKRLMNDFDLKSIEKMDTGSVPGFETVTENGKLVKSEDKETKADHIKWL